MTTVAIVDCGAGNNQSVRNAFDMAGADASMVATPEEVRAADRLVLPGVGAAGRVMTQLRERRLDEALTEAVRQRGRPTLGICLGMQIAAGTLREYGDHRGLAWIDGDVRDLHDIDGVRGRIPHMGWNEIEVADSASVLFDHVKGRLVFYFCHSFALRDTDQENVAATVDYGIPLAAAVLDETFFATQFHPEKSQLKGQQLIEAFLDWSP